MPLEMNLRRLNDPTRCVVRSAPLNLVDDVAAVGEAELVVAPISVPVGRVRSVEAIADNAGIEELDEPVVVCAEKTDANRGGTKLVALSRRRLGNGNALQPCVMRAAVLTGREIPIG
jgi:hypothetical protein